jgi:hypothetical protein
LAPGGSGLEPDAVKQITNACALPVAWSAVKKLLAERDVALLSAGLDEVPGVQNRMGELRPCGQGDQFSQRQSTAGRSRSAPAPAASRSTRIASHDSHPQRASPSGLGAFSEIVMARFEKNRDRPSTELRFAMLAEFKGGFEVRQHPDETVSIRPVEFTFNHRDLENIGALPLPN